MKTFREVVAESMAAVIAENTPLTVSEPIGVDDLIARVLPSERVALMLKGRLKVEGYAIHEARLCVRPGPPEAYGRPMTPEEIEQIKPRPLRHPRRRRPS